MRQINMYGSKLLDLRKGRGRNAAGRIVASILLLAMMMTFLSACGGDPHAQQMAQQNRTELDHAIRNAQNIGVPGANLKPIITQEQAVSATSAPLALFNDAPVTQYYNNIAARYKLLAVQLQGVVQVSTEQLAQQAQDNLQGLHSTLAAKQTSNLPLTTISQLYSQDMANMQKARYPKDFAAISQQAKDATQTVNMLPDTISKLQMFHEVIGLLQDGHQDVTTQQKQYDDDNNAVAKATTPGDLQKINQAVDAQNQQVMTSFTQVIPLLTQAKLDDFNSKVQQLKQYGIDTTNYQKRLDADRAQAPNVKTMQDFMAFAKQVDSDLGSMHKDLLKGQAIALIQQFHTDVNNWGNAHQYYDKYNGQSYPLDIGYMTKGIGEDLDRELSAAVTANDYQQVLTDTQNVVYHFQMMQANANDSTPYTQPHATDLKLLDYYKLRNAKVIVVSFLEEALRVYDHGQLVRAFLITAGRPELPPVPGLWVPLWRLTHTTFKSPYPQGSPYWYPDTPINYAILYHLGGYYLHDSWWRNDYGPGTQFFHIDSSGNVSANYGTHGCINMPEDQAAWVYNNTDYNTQVVMY